MTLKRQGVCMCTCVYITNSIIHFLKIKLVLSCPGPDIEIFFLDNFCCNFVMINGITCGRIKKKRYQFKLIRVFFSLAFYKSISEKNLLSRHFFSPVAIRLMYELCKYGCTCIYNKLNCRWTYNFTLLTTISGGTLRTEF